MKRLSLPVVAALVLTACATSSRFSHTRHE